MNDTQYTVEPLIELRMNALLMSLANTHLCEDIFLAKLGHSIETNVASLKQDISALKKQFPGKFANEVDTDSILEMINETAKEMIDPVDEIREKCVIGELGKGLEADIKSVDSAVKEIKVQVFGHDVVYSKKDSVSNIFSGLKDLGGSFGSALLQSLKILCVVIIIAIPVFSYLYFTMDSEEDLLAEITVNDTRIKAQQEILKQLISEEVSVSSEIASLEIGKIDRDEKIAILDLEMSIHRINEERHKADAEIDSFENENAETLKKIDKIKNTSLIKRLLRMNPKN